LKKEELIRKSGSYGNWEPGSSAKTSNRKRYSIVQRKLTKNKARVAGKAERHSSNSLGKRLN
jgi:hypothetical protein